MYEVSIIQHIQSVRNAFFDGLFSFVTLIGDEMFFILVAVALFWCVDKRFGYKLINVYLLGCACVEGIKTLVARPRPYTYDGIVSVSQRTFAFDSKFIDSAFK